MSGAHVITLAGKKESFKNVSSGSKRSTLAEGADLKLDATFPDKDDRILNVQI